MARKKGEKKPRKLVPSKSLAEGLKESVFMNDANFCPYILVDEIPSVKAVHAFHQLEKLGILKSAFLRRGDSLVRAFRFNGVDKLPREEPRQHYSGCTDEFCGGCTD